MRPGRPYRTLVGRLAVDEVTRGRPRPTSPPTRRAGPGSGRRALLAEAGRHAEEGRRSSGSVSTGSTTRSPQRARRDPALVVGSAELAAALDAIDRRSGHGPWAWATLRAIAAEPGRRAPDLAAASGRDTAPFKTDVRSSRRWDYPLASGRLRALARGRAVLATRS